MTSEPEPDSRLYLHVACGTATPASGGAFEVLSDPFADVHAAYCAACRAHRPLGEFVWADTGEGLPAARARWAARTPTWARLVTRGYGWPVLLATCTALGFVVGWAVEDPTDVVAYRWRWEGALVGAGAGVCLLKVLRPYIRWRYYGPATVRLTR